MFRVKLSNLKSSITDRIVWVSMILHFW